ncbi:MAG: hypothetical protein CUN53_09390 [Phototrophicales bacterium]|nr:MAG: hypothetical protein CUN53_09390 [Phototrophicales bacterium]
MFRGQFIDHIMALRKVLDRALKRLRHMMKMILVLALGGQAMSNRPQRPAGRPSEQQRTSRPLTEEDPFPDLFPDNPSAQTTQRPQSKRQRTAPPPKQRERGGSRLGIGLFVFIGTLLGTLTGIAADAGGAADTIERFRSFFYPELCVAGSNTILGEGIEMAADWKRQFESENNVRVRIDGVGSVRGVERAVRGECVHVLAMSEPMTIEQYNALRGANVEIDCAAEVGYDIVAFVTDIGNRLPALLERNLRSILRGQITDWRTVGGAPGPIRLLARPGSGTTEVVLRNVAGWLDDNLDDDQYFPPGTDYIPCRSNDACLDTTLATPGSLYWVSTAWMRTQPEQFLRVMPILRGDERPINPLTEQVNLNEYPSSLVRPLYLYVLNSAAIPEENRALAREFLFFVRSVRGQMIVEKHYFYAFFNSPQGVRVELPPGFEPDETGLRPVCRA